MKTNQDYKNEAFAALHDNWSPAVVATLLYCFIIAAVVGPSEVKSIPYYLLCGSSLVGIFALNPLSVGFMNAFRMLVDSKDNRITRNMFVIGFTNWLHIVWVTFLMNVFIFLWTLLLVIPGIIKAFSYAMTPFIITEHPEMSANDAIDESRRIMAGHKFDLFYLFLSFIGWFLLGILSLGIGFFWIIPYVQAAEVAFYNDIKGGPHSDSAQPHVFHTPSAGAPSADASSTAAPSSPDSFASSSPDSFAPKASAPAAPTAAPTSSDSPYAPSGTSAPASPDSPSETQPGQ